MWKVALVLTLFFGAPAVAQEGLQIIPKYTFTGTAACYDFEGTKTLLALDSELVACRKVTPALEKQVKALRAALDSKELEVSANIAQILLLQQNFDRSEEALKKALQEKQELIAAQANSDLGWVVTGGLALILVTSATTYWLTH